MVEEKKTKKKKNAADMQAELRDLTKATDAPQRPIDYRKIFTRVGGILVALWVAALFIPTWIPKAVVGGITLIAIGGSFWFIKYVQKTQALGDILRGADTAEGRKGALKQLEEGYKKGDTQAVLARAQLEMQDDPRKALATLETVKLDKVLTPIADQVRSMRAMIHLTLGETAEARALADQLELGKQQEPKTRAMFAAVASEAWARTGNAKKAVETLELFNPDADDLAEIRVQMWRARAFAYAGVSDMKGCGRALRKLAETSPQLLAMFVGAKKIHPLLEREAKQLLMKSGALPRKMVRQRV